MVDKKYPGVYVEEVSLHSLPIQGVACSHTGFVGIANKGPLDQVVSVTSWHDYEIVYGKIQGHSDTMGIAVQCFFDNGGQQAMIARVAAPDSQCAQNQIHLSQHLGKQFSGILKISAANPGAWGSELGVTIEPEKGRHTFSLQVVKKTDAGRVDPVESFSHLSLDNGAPNFLLNQVNSTSKCIRVKLDYQRSELSKKQLKSTNQAEITWLNNPPGDDGSELNVDHFRTFFASPPERLESANMLVLPGQAWGAGAGASILSIALSYCEKTQSTMLITDIATSLNGANQADVQNLSLPDSAFLCCYYPWIQLDPSNFNLAQNATIAPNTWIAPSASVAGVWASIELQTGVWKAPAGMDAGLVGVSGLSEQIDDQLNSLLNSVAINCIRQISNIPAVIWGARTQSNNMSFRYINVQRLLLFIQNSIRTGLQWAVFEPNDHNLWEQIRFDVEQFLAQLYRQGGLQGAKSEDAYYVRCGLGETMTQNDLNNKKLIITFGFAASKPAEFINSRIVLTSKG